jgi:hypothetical protein
MTATLVVLPRFPTDRTGTGQRSRLLVEAAVAAGPAHVVLLDGSGHAPAPGTIPGAASITALRSERITPRGVIARRLGGALRVARPGRAYAPDPALRAALLDLVERHRIGTVVFRYAPLFCAAGITAEDGLRVLVDVDDRDDQKYRSRLTRLFGPRLAGNRLARRQLARIAGLLQARLSRASHVWFVTREDAWPLSPATTGLLPNVPYWDPPAGLPPARGTEPLALFVGLHDHLPNQDGMRWFLAQVWPSLRRAVPEARLRVVGRGRWPEMAREYPGIEGVEFVGEAEDLAAEYAAARMTVCPVREGGGSKIKLIESAAFARPVVATPHAARGFHGEGLAHVAQADGPAAFAEACAAFLRDPAAAERAGAALKAWQRASYSRDAFIAEAMRALSPDRPEQA